MDPVNSLFLHFFREKHSAHTFFDTRECSLATIFPLEYIMSVINKFLRTQNTELCASLSTFILQTMVLMTKEERQNRSKLIYGLRVFWCTST